MRPRLPFLPSCLQDRGTLHLKVTYTPFFQPSFDDEGDASSAAKAITKIPRRVVTHNVPDSLKVGP